MTTNRNPRIVIWAMSLSLLLGLAGTFGFIPSVEAASSSASARIIKKLKKQIKTLKKQLAAARAVAAPAPFIEMVTVGNPGNAADPSDGDLSTGGTQSLGAVAATFRIGKFEVTNSQYVAFLNAVAATDTNGLFNASMETNARGGIDQFGTSGNFRYAARAGMGDKPVNFVSFWACCRFCNWLHNGRPSGLQSAFTTETGAYDLTIPGAIASNTVTRSPGAKFFLPTEDQWYKAAYHQPASTGGDTDGYWFYPTKSNDVPSMATVDAIGETTNDTANLANYDDGADWDSNGDEGIEDGNLTAVGSGGAGSASFYEAFDMGGNAKEWIETIGGGGAGRKYRGGSWEDSVNNLSSSIWGYATLGITRDSIGFRVAGL